MSDASAAPLGRRERYAVLARAQRGELLKHLDQSFPDRATLVPDAVEEAPTVATAPLQVSLPGTAQRAMVAEIALTVARVVSGSGKIGYGFIIGNHGNKAKCVAWLDLLGQVVPERIMPIIQALKDQQTQAVMSDMREIEATRVDFFTLMRGDNPS